MSVGGVPGSVTPDTTPVDDTSATTAPTDTTTVDTTDSVSRTATSARPAPAAAPARASDVVPASILERYGLSTDSLATESRYEGAEWNVGYYPYDGNIQYVAFGKHAQIFGAEGHGDAHSYFEFYSNPPSGLRPGSRIADGSIDESNFEMSAGVSIDGRDISDAAYRAIVESGSPDDATFALTDASGNEIPLSAGDRLVPTTLRDGKPVEVEIDAGSWRTSYRDPATGQEASDVVWRVQSEDGSIRYDAGDQTAGRSDLLGLKDGTAFDFLDATGRMVGFDPGSGDRIVPGFADGDDWHVLAKGDGTPPSYEHQVVRGGSVVSTEALSEDAAKALMDGKEIIHRVQTSGGQLKGDGRVNETYDMSWWGKCHNVASIGTSNMPRPSQDVRVVTNLEAGDTLGLRWGDERLAPERGADGAITGYTHTAADGSTRSLSAADATALADQARADGQAVQPVVIKPDGTEVAARVSNISTREADALVSHIGDGAVIPKGGHGSRYYAHPDIFVLKDGTQVQGHIQSVKTAGGEQIEIGDREGLDYEERDRGALRAPGMSSRVLGDGSGRSYAFNVQEMSGLNAYRDDDITEFTVLNPDGSTRTISADDVELFAWENKFDFSPDQLWDLHKTVGEEGSTVIEADPGTHVWNYTIRSATTEPVRVEDLPDWQRDEVAEKMKQPGMMSGTVGDENRYLFRSEVNGSDYLYWVRFDPANGDIVDFAYLDDSVPDFTWTQHIKDAYDQTWTGESQAPGVKNGDIQRVYLASTGGLNHTMLPGGYIAEGDLRNATAVRPQQ